VETQDALKKVNDFTRNSATLKVISIGILVLILLIPSVMITSLMRERESRKNSVIWEITQKWGSSQTITGPFLTVPYKVFYKDEKDKMKSKIQYIHILPESLNISGNIDPQIRYRSIYEAVLYNMQININGNFTIPVLTQSNINPENVLWEKAALSIGITDMRGIKDNVIVEFDNNKYKTNPGLITADIASAGLKCPVPVSHNENANKFSLKLNLNGSERLQFIPAGETNTVKLKSTWSSPSFNGAFLPVTREVTDKGFNADWNILHLNRNFPQFWLGNKYKVSESSFGLSLIITADVYQKSTRISKYAIMFIVFTFSAFFFSEVINRKRVHPIQYLLIGLAIMLFYLLLLSISEHLNFDIAYIISAIAITATITGYSQGIIKNKYFTLTVSIILIALYTYLYIVLQLEDYSLLMGSVGLFLVLTTVMYITRKIDWYSIDKEQT